MSDQKFDETDRRICDALRAVEPRPGFQQRLMGPRELNKTESSEFDSKIEIAAQKMWWRQKRLVRAMAFAACVLVLAGAVVVISNINSGPEQVAEGVVADLVQDEETDVALNELESLAQQAERLEAQFELLSAQSRKIAQRRAAISYQPTQQSWNERAAGTIVLSADLHRRLSTSHGSSQSDYELVVSRFSDSSWADVARTRLNQTNLNQ